MKLFSSTKPNYFIEVIDSKVSTSLLSLAIKDSPQVGVEKEFDKFTDVDTLMDLLLTFEIEHPYAEWLKQYIPFINHYSNFKEDVKLPDSGYWKLHKFKLINANSVEKEGKVKLLRLNKNVDVKNFVSFDVESTGIVPEVDRVIQVAAAKYKDGKVVDTLNLYVKPDNYDNKEGEFYLSDTIVDLTGIKDSDIVNAPRLKDIANEFLSFIDGEILVGHNLEFDISIMTAEFNRNSIEFPSVQYYDTYLEAKELMPFQPRGGYKLEVLKEKVEMGHLDSHDALNDCYIAGNLFIHLNGISRG